LFSFLPAHPFGFTDLRHVDGTMPVKRARCALGCLCRQSLYDRFVKNTTFERYSSRESAKTFVQIKRQEAGNWLEMSAHLSLSPLELIAPSGAQAVALPRLPQTHVRRSRLVDRLVQSDCRLRLLNSPAGFGK